MKKIAVFDIDGTIFRSSLLIELTEALVAAGLFPERTKKIYENEYQNWLDRNGPYKDYIEAVVAAFAKNIKGLKRNNVYKVADEVVEFHKNRVYRYTRDLVKSLRKKGYFLLAVSHSPKSVVDDFCKNFGFDRVYGTFYETDKNDRFTGRVSYSEIISDKSKILKRVLERGKITLSGSVGVGDTESDISFLKMVSQPICFNPNKKLFSFAKRVGWKIVVERKDVIYFL